MNPTETAEQLRLMRTRAVLCYNATPSGPVYSIHATVSGLGVLSGAADLIEAQAAQIAELQAAVAAEREACAAMARGFAEDICDPLYANRVRQLAGRISRRGTT
jgi:hypothetical protein